MSYKEELIEILEQVLKKTFDMKHEAVGEYRVYTNDEGDYLSVYSPLNVEYTLHSTGELYIQTKFRKDMHEFYKMDILVEDAKKLLSIIPKKDFTVRKEAIKARIEGLEEELKKVEEMEQEEQ